MRVLLIGLLCAMTGMSVQAATEDEAKQLYDALALAQIVDIMQQEGLDYGAQVGTEMFPDRVDDDWQATVGAIYDPLAMHRRVEDAFVTAVAESDAAPMIAFFETDPGQSFVTLEVSARRAMLDEAIDEASREAAAIAMADKTPRFELVDGFAQTNDLIDSNVVGALNSNFAFYKGLLAGGAFDATLTEDQILADVWEQEPQLRISTAEWVYSFLILAYGPMADEDITTYIAFSQSDAGRALNTALFETFDGMFEDISYALGYAAANKMSGQDL